MTNCHNIIDDDDEDDEGDDGAQDGEDHNGDDDAQYGDDDNDDAGDPWQQYMAAQMAVGGGYSPHMYSHRWAIASSRFPCCVLSYFSQESIEYGNQLDINHISKDKV